MLGMAHKFSAVYNLVFKKVVKGIIFNFYKKNIKMFLYSKNKFKFGDGDGPNLCRVKSRC